MTILDDWGPNVGDDSNPVDLESMSDERLARLGLFFGGVGDARHVFGSVIGIRKAYDKLNVNRRQVMKVHIVMNDIHPTALARDLCVLALLDETASASGNKALVAELKMTILCLWMGFIMPPYSFTR